MGSSPARSTTPAARIGFSDREQALSVGGRQRERHGKGYRSENHERQCDSVEREHSAARHSAIRAMNRRWPIRPSIARSVR